MVGADYDHVANKDPRKIVAKIHTPDGRVLGRYSILPEGDGYVLPFGDNRLGVRKGESGPEKGRFYLTSIDDVSRLPASRTKKPES